MLAEVRPTPPRLGEEREPVVAKKLFMGDPKKSNGGNSQQRALLLHDRNTEPHFTTLSTE
jgi:hypothetical protein